MSTNPYQSPTDVSIPVADVDQDAAALKSRTLRLWILPTGLAGVASGFALSLFLLANFEVLREFASVVISFCIVAVGLACLWVGDWMFESSSKQ